MDFLLFGGSFDPPHQGHLELLSAALRETGARAIVMPSWQNPLKSASQAPAPDRLAMIELALKTLPAPLRRRVEVSRWELSRRRSFTAETLDHLKTARPNASFGLLIGSDSLAGFPKWRRCKDILSSATLVVGRRPGGRPAAPAGAKVRRLKGLFPPLSSTAVREALASGDEVPLPAGVSAYIRKRGLYDLDLHAWLAARLRAERYNHTLEVVRMARRLAHHHGLDAERARRAALLHDAGRSLKASDMPAYVRRRRVVVPHGAETARKNPLLLHAYVSADLARRRLGVDDPAVLSAIRNHTLGAPGMGPLDRLLYVADICSEDREFPSALRLRELAFEDLERAFRDAVNLKLRWALIQEGWLHPQGVALWNSLANHS